MRVVIIDVRNDNKCAVMITARDDQRNFIESILRFSQPPLPLKKGLRAHSSLISSFNYIIIDETQSIKKPQQT